MAVAAQVGCSWCLDFNYFHAHNEGLDERKASEVPRWRESTVFTSLERDVLEYAEAMTATASRGSPTSCRPACSSSSARRRWWS
jgi:AhpD family alkylhydroperoxidase